MDCTEYKDYYNRKSNFNRINGMNVMKLERGYAEVEMTVNDNSLNVLGSLHGGALYTLADTAAGVASLSYGITSVTLNGRLSQQPWKLKWRFPAQIWHNGFGKQPKPYREVTANVSIPQEGRSVDRKECLPVTNGAIDSIRFTGSCERTI